MTHPLQAPGRRRAASVVLALCAMLVPADAAVAGDGKDGRNEVRVAGSCGAAAATSKLRLRSRDGGIEVEFEVEHARVGALWRVAIVHERRVVWKATSRGAATDGSFRVDRRLQDLAGSDAVTARASGPAGVICRAAATLPDQ